MCYCTVPQRPVARVKPISDYMIELLVRYPSSLPADVRKAVEDYVAEDPFGRSVAIFYRTYYKELDALKARDGSCRHCAFNPPRRSGD